MKHRKINQIEGVLLEGFVQIQNADSTICYWLVNGEQMALLHPDTFEIPSRQERENMLPETNVKLEFRIKIGESIFAERMWVIVEKNMGDHYIGTLNNIPTSTNMLRVGDEVIFKPQHILRFLLSEEVPSYIEHLTNQANGLC